MEKPLPLIIQLPAKKIFDVQEGDKADVDKAVAAAKEAFKLG
jgi:acyl-CoA reductase-like NAD-dependent aldehyde dehydrogenase